MSIEFEIRPFITGDGEETAALIRDTLRISNKDDYSEEYIEKIVESHSSQWLTERMSDSHFYVACDGQKIIACGGITGYLGSTSESFLLSIFVLPSYQGMGVGRKIVEALECDEYFQRAWRTEIASSVTAVDFYRRLGYGFKNGITSPDEYGVVRLEKIKK